MAFYDDIAKQWHEATGFKGGAFKELVLNDILIRHISKIQGRRILELGAGNGYFMPMLLRRYSGQVPGQIVITDQSERQLGIATRFFGIDHALYQSLDVGRPFPFPEGSLDLVIATMIFNEVSSDDLARALRECHRVLNSAGLLLMTVTHPSFINDLDQRRMLQTDERGALTMPGAGSLRLPVQVRPVEDYETLLNEVGFQFERESVFPTPQVLKAKGGLRYAKNLPLALVFKCRKQEL